MDRPEIGDSSNTWNQVTDPILTVESVGGEINRTPYIEPTHNSPKPKTKKRRSHTSSKLVTAPYLAQTSDNITTGKNKRQLKTWNKEVTASYLAQTSDNPNPGTKK